MRGGKKQSSGKDKNTRSRHKKPTDLAEHSKSTRLKYTKYSSTSQANNFLNGMHDLSN